MGITQPDMLKIMVGFYIAWSEARKVDYEDYWLGKIERRLFMDIVYKLIYYILLFRTTDNTVS
jgi:hypothetical protein